jgi:hypothetical protein
MTTGLAGGDWNDIGKSALTGAIAGAIGGAVGIYAGSSSGSAFGGTMAGTGAGTAGGIGWGALVYGDMPTWESAGIAFASAFGGAIASTALGNGVRSLAEQDTSGEAGAAAAGKAAKSSYEAQRAGRLEAAATGESAGRTVRFTSALLDQRGSAGKAIEMTCGYVRCVDPGSAPADVVARARSYAFMQGHSSALLGHEVGAVDVRTASGDVTARQAVPVGRDVISFNVLQSGDIPLQYNHSHVPALGHSDEFRRVRCCETSRCRNDNVLANERYNQHHVETAVWRNGTDECVEVLVTINALVEKSKADDWNPNSGFLSSDLFDSE